MPYKAGQRLPGERASRLGHLEVLKSDLVLDLVKAFESTSTRSSALKGSWERIPSDGQPLSLVFGVDGSMQVIDSDTPPRKSMGFVKTALLRLDSAAISELDRDCPHPLALRDLLSASALCVFR